MAQCMDFCEDCGEMIDAAQAGLCWDCYHDRYERPSKQSLFDCLIRIIFNQKK